MKEIKYKTDILLNTQGRFIVSIPDEHQGKFIAMQHREVHVTLSPVQSQESFVPQDKPDYEAVVTDLLKDTDMKLKTIKEEMATMSLPVQREMNTMFIIPLKGQRELIEKLIKEHTPQSDQSTGMKKEET